MAEFPTTDLNSQLIAAGLNTSNPTQTYVDFGNTMAKNQQEQAAQEQAIALAKERVAQAKFETANQVSDAMTPEEARAYLQIVAQSKGLNIDQASIDKWVALLPAHVNRQIVESFANRFARETTRAGQSTPFEETDIIQIPEGKSATDLGLTDMKDASGTSVDDKTKSDGTFTASVPNAGMYQVLYDNQGVIQKFIPGGKEPVDQTAKLALKAEESGEKQWQKLDAAVNNVVKQGRGNQLMIAINRSNRALDLLADPTVLMPQILSYIQKDLSGIFQGGVPPQSGAEAEDFTTAYQAANAFMQKYTGVSGFFKTDLGNQRQKLMDIVTRLRDGSIDMVEKLILAKEAGYKQIIDDNPDRWQKMVHDYMTSVGAGLSATAQAATKAATAATTVQPVPGVRTAAKTVPEYTVEK